ncbi:Mitochondrial inner membrane protease subunit 2 [Metarhizium anisopliae]|nr:Mitochondrial inner membrane protease subunit 2 [Metarhizium anisopliae]
MEGPPPTASATNSTSLALEFAICKGCWNALPSLNFAPHNVDSYTTLPRALVYLSGGVDAPMAPGSIWSRLRIPPSGLARAVTLNLMGFATWIPVIAWFNMHVAELTFVDGSSMYPFLNEDKDSTLRRDFFLNYKWSPQEGLERGMVVTLRSPYNPEVVAVKRVVALEGDVVRTKKPYPIPTVRIPQGHVWVEGDGPAGSSLDSNTYGPVSKRLLTGRVTHIVYPWRKFGQVRWWEHESKLVE